MVVRPSTQDLWGHVLKSATDSIGSGSLGQAAGQTKVCQFQMASFIQKDILHLHIPMDDAQIMEIAQHQNQFSSKEADGSLSKAANRGPQGVQICTAVAAHNEEVPFSLPAVPQTVYKRMVDLSLGMKKTGS